MHQVEVDIEKRRRAGTLPYNMAVPNFLDNRPRLRGRAVCCDMLSKSTAPDWAPTLKS